LSAALTLTFGSFFPVAQNPNLAANPYSDANCFINCMNKATKELEHSLVNIVSSVSSAGITTVHPNANLSLV